MEGEPSPSHVGGRAARTTLFFAGEILLAGLGWLPIFFLHRIARFSFENMPFVVERGGRLPKVPHFVSSFLF